MQLPCLKTRRGIRLNDQTFCVRKLPSSEKTSRTKPRFRTNGHKPIENIKCAPKFLRNSTGGLQISRSRSAIAASSGRSNRPEDFVTEISIADGRISLIFRSLNLSVAPSPLASMQRTGAITTNKKPIRINSLRARGPQSRVIRLR